jgi:DNA polymerase III sliding clamp (beta) subunit (PCNA family)
MSSPAVVDRLAVGIVGGPAMTGALHVILKADALDAVLAIVSHTAVPATARSGIPILSAAKLEAADGGLEASCTNLVARCAARAAATVVTAGTAAIAVERLKKIVATLPGDTDVDLRQVGAVVVVRHGSSQERLPALPPDDFPPPLTPTEPCFRLQVPCRELRPLCDSMLLASMLKDSELSRSSVLGFCWTNSNGRLLAFATDGVGLIVLDSAIVVGDRFPDVRLLAKTRAELSALLKEDGNVDIAVSRSLLQLTTERVVYCTKMLAERPVDHRRIIPPVPRAVAETASMAFLEALERVTAVSTATTPPIVGVSWDADINSTAVQLTLPHETGAALDVVAATVHGSARSRCRPADCSI